MRITCPASFGRGTGAATVGGDTTAAGGGALAARIFLGNYQIFPATRADLARLAGRLAAALEAYDAAIALAGNAAERTYVEQKRAAL